MTERELELSSHALAAEAIISVLNDNGLAVDAIGHRFVHGGAELTSTIPIDGRTLPGLRETAHLAPIHNPNSLSVIEVCLPAVPGHRPVRQSSTRCSSRTCRKRPTHTPFRASSRRGSLSASSASTASRTST